MNWKTVLRLVSVNVKASRMIRGEKFRRYRENKAVTYALYLLACALGLLVGWIVGNFFRGITDLALRNVILEGAANLFVTLPTIVLLYGLVFTQMSQIQRAGFKISIQPLYWLPITWEEHTVASVLANMLGAPLIITTFICSSILLASLFLGLVPLAVFTVFALLVSLFLASITTEAFKILQVRISGTVTKAAGRAAVWVRLISSVIFFVVFYLVYFSLYYNVSPLTLIESVVSGQKMLWFIPYLWPGVALSALASGFLFETVLFSLASLAFIYFLFRVAVNLNVRFGLYEAPSLKISRGVYAPKAGFLGKLGFSSLEAAIIRKDFKAFTRRYELMFIFIFPIIVIIMPILSTMRGSALPQTFSPFLFVYLTLLPGALMTVILGSIIVGSEGKGINYLFASPISAKSLIKAKYSFTTIFSLAVTLICSVVAGLLTVPSIQIAVIGFVEAVFLIFALAGVSLTFGIKGADFRELPPRPRMIEPIWSLVNLVVCLFVGLLIVAPLIPYGIMLIFEAGDWLAISLPLPEYYPYLALFVSGIIANAIAFVFYKMALGNAEKLLLKAEV